jgi:hypothetical protein
MAKDSISAPRTGPKSEIARCFYANSCSLERKLRRESFAPSALTKRSLFPSVGRGQLAASLNHPVNSFYEGARSLLHHPVFLCKIDASEFAFHAACLNVPCRTASSMTSHDVQRLSPYIDVRLCTFIVIPLLTYTSTGNRLSCHVSVVVQPNVLHGFYISIYIYMYVHNVELSIAWWEWQHSAHLPSPRL